MTPRNNDQLNSPDLSISSSISKSYLDTPQSINTQSLQNQSQFSTQFNDDDYNDNEMKEKMLNTEKQLVFF